MTKKQVSHVRADTRYLPRIIEAQQALEEFERYASSELLPALRRQHLHLEHAAYFMDSAETRPEATLSDPIAQTEDAFRSVGYLIEHGNFCREFPMAKARTAFLKAFLEKQGDLQDMRLNVLRAIAGTELYTPLDHKRDDHFRTAGKGSWTEDWNVGDYVKNAIVQLVIIGHALQRLDEELTSDSHAMKARDLGDGSIDYGQYLAELTGAPYLQEEIERNSDKSTTGIDLDHKKYQEGQHIDAIVYKGFEKLNAALRPLNAVLREMNQTVARETAR